MLHFCVCNLSERDYFSDKKNLPDLLGGVQHSAGLWFLKDFFFGKSVSTLGQKFADFQRDIL
jgi:hypothetical protein